MPAKNLDDGKQPKDTSKGVGPMPHQAYAAHLRATVDESTYRSGVDMRKAAELGDWARAAKAADK